MSIIDEKKDYMEHDSEKEQGSSSRHKSLLFRIWERASKRDQAKEEAEETAAVQAQEEEVVKPPVDDSIATLYGIWMQLRHPDEAKQTLRDDTPEEEYSKDFDDFHKKMSDHAKSLINQYGRDGGLPDSDAQIKIQLSADRLRAWMYIVGPCGEGTDITKETVNAAMEQAGVTYGRDENLLEQIYGEKLYFRILTVARGTPSKPGKDGEIEELFERESEVQIKQDARGVADYKNLNLIHQVEEGAVICRIIKPTEGVDGVNVRGETVHGQAGKAAFIPRGNNTVLSEDGSELRAAVDGRVSYVNNLFRVDKVLIIEGDVDNSVGNQDFMGDIVVNGDVRGGFTLKAKGSIAVKGMVENATLIAEGDVILSKGMNGDNHGVIEARGSVKSKFLENCAVHAGGSVTSESIICCDVFSDDKIQVLNGKGVIIGGSVTASKTVEAKNIGSKANRPTTVVLGRTPNMLRQEGELREKLREVQKQIGEMERDIAYLEAFKKLDGNRQQRLNQCRLQKPLKQMQESKLINELKELREQMGNLTDCRLKAGTLFPSTKIVIGDANLVVPDTAINCNVFYADDKVIIGKNG